MTIEATPELIEAATALSAYAAANNDTHLGRRLALVLAALPEEVTNPKPELPTESGSVIKGEIRAFPGQIYFLMKAAPSSPRDDGNPWLTDCGHWVSPEDITAWEPVTTERKQFVTADELVEVNNRKSGGYWADNIADYINNR